MRLQLALNVDDLEEAIDFYSKMFDAPPAKVKPTTRELQEKRAASVDRRIIKWERKLRRAQNALVKLRKQKRYYGKVLSE